MSQALCAPPYLTNFQFSMFKLTDKPIDPRALCDAVRDPSAGGFASFEGWVRNHHQGRDVASLEYEAFPALAEKGEELFVLKCSMCHKIESRYIGPQLDDVLTKRTPEYVMNMILNPVEMTQKHPEARKLLAEYSSPMANQSLTEEETRSILEYLRTVSK